VELRALIAEQNELMNTFRDWTKKEFSKTIQETSNMTQIEDSNLSRQIININKFLAKQKSWLFEKFQACSTGALNHSTVDTHLKDYPSFDMITSRLSLIIPSNKYFQIINKQSSQLLSHDGSCRSRDDTVRGKVGPDSIIWTIEPVD
jgi:flagellar biosynthesis/type III secretory pathway chaperone